MILVATFGESLGAGRPSVSNSEIPSPGDHDCEDGVIGEADRQEAEQQGRIVPEPKVLV